MSGFKLDFVSVSVPSRSKTIRSLSASDDIFVLIFVYCHCIKVELIDVHCPALYDENPRTLTKFNGKRFSMEPEKQLSPGQYYLLRKVKQSERVRAAAILADAELSTEAKSSLDQAKKRLTKGRIVINLNLHEEIFGMPLIDSLIISRRLYNVFEVAQGSLTTSTTPSASPCSVSTAGTDSY